VCVFVCVCVWVCVCVCGRARVPMLHLHACVTPGVQGLEGAHVHTRMPCKACSASSNIAIVPHT
jgi:hypothetical protein